MSRTKEIREAVQDFLTKFDIWADPRNGRPAHPDHEFWTAYQDLIDKTNRGDHPKDCRRIVAAVLRLNSEGDAYDNQDQLALAETFLRSVDELRSALSYAGVRRTRPPSVTELMALDRMSKHQVCVIWGLFRPDGSADEESVNQELAEPGSIIGADYWPPYIQKQIDDEEGDRLYRKAIDDRGGNYSSTEYELEDSHFGVGELDDDSMERTIVSSFEGMSYTEMIDQAKSMGVNPYKVLGGSGRPSREQVALLIHETEEKQDLQSAAESAGSEPPVAEGDESEDDDETEPAPGEESVTWT